MFDFFTVKPQPDIYLFGATIHEPVTAATGLLVSAVCWAAYRQLDKKGATHWPARLMAYFFIALGWSNFIGALAGHAFYEQLGLVWKVPGWTLGMIAVAFVAQASIFRLNGAGRVKGLSMALSTFNLLVFSILLWLSIDRLNFKMVEIYTGIGLIGIMLPIEISLHRKEISAASIWMMKALVPAVLAVFLHIIQFSVSQWFNFFDIGHILICGTVIYFSRSTRIMRLESNF